MLTGLTFPALTTVTLKGATGFDPSNYSNVIYFETILPNGTTRLIKPNLLCRLMAVALTFFDLRDLSFLHSGIEKLDGS